MLPQQIFRSWKWRNQSTETGRDKHTWYLSLPLLWYGDKCVLSSMAFTLSITISSLHFVRHLHQFSSLHTHRINIECMVISTHKILSGKDKEVDNVWQMNIKSVKSREQSYFLALFGVIGEKKNWSGLVWPQALAIWLLSLPLVPIYCWNCHFILYWSASALWDGYGGGAMLWFTTKWQIDADIKYATNIFETKYVIDIF